MDEGKKRAIALGRVEEALGNIGIAEKRYAESKAHHDKVVNDARSAMGTARQQLEQRHTEYLKARDQLRKLLPEKPGDCDINLDSGVYALYTKDAAE